MKSSHSQTDKEGFILSEQGCLLKIARGLWGVLWPLGRILISKMTNSTNCPKTKMKAEPKSCLLTQGEETKDRASITQDFSTSTLQSSLIELAVTIKFLFSPNVPGFIHWQFVSFPSSASFIFSTYSSKMSRNRPQDFSGMVIAVRKFVFTCKETTEI